MGYHPRRDIEGKRFGRLLVVRRLKGSIAQCRCDCGRLVEVSIGHLGKQKSCGCWRIEKRYKHGLHKSPEYKTWEKIKQRCYNPNNHSYKDYGGRGILVHDRWAEDFMEFFKDVGARPGPAYTIDRIDPNGNYEPGNVRWLLKGLQSRNKRDHRLMTYQGRTQPAYAWAEELHIPIATIRTRLHRGWTDEQALTLPPQKGKKPTDA